MESLRGLISDPDKRAQQAVSTLSEGVQHPEAFRLDASKLKQYLEKSDRESAEKKDAASRELENLGTHAVDAIVGLLRDHPDRGFLQGFLPTYEVVMVYTMPIATKIVSTGGVPETVYVIEAL